MLKNTKAHRDSLKDQKKSIRVGNKVPKGALNLAYYHNNNVPLDQNVVVSSAPKQTIDHLSVEEQLIKNCLPTKDTSHFPVSIPYTDTNNYYGEMFLDRIIWTDHVHSKEKYVTVSKEYEVTSMTLPESSIEYEEDGMSGVLGIVEAEYIPIEYEDKEVPKESKKFVRDTRRASGLTSPSYDFPESFEYNQGGYTGTIHKIPNSIRYIPTITDSTVNQAYKEASGDKEFMYIDGYRYPRLDRREEVINLTSYGLSRVHSAVESGYYNGQSGTRWDDVHPRPNFQLTRWCPNQFRPVNPIFKVSADTRLDAAYSTSITGLPSPPSYAQGVTAKYFRRTTDGSTSANDHNGEEWCLNWEAINKLDSSNRTGYFWADKVTMSDILKYGGVSTTKEAAQNMGVDYIKNDKVAIFGDTNYKEVISHRVNDTVIDDYNLFYSHIWIPKKHAHKIEVSKRVQAGLDDRGAVEIGTMQPYARDVLVFYKGKKRTVISTYGGTVITAGTVSYKAECDYEGVVRNASSDKEPVPTKWLLKAKFGGTISSYYVDYNGVGMYSGVATKRDAIGNINPTGSNVRIMYPNDLGVLYEDLNVLSSNQIETTHAELTDMFKDGVPLFYKYRLKNKVYSGEKPTPQGFVRNLNIELLNSRNKRLKNDKKYAVKLIPTGEKDVYWCDVYTSFQTNINNKVKCIYVGIDKTKADFIEINSEEYIYPKIALDPREDFILDELDSIDRRSIISVRKPSIFDDTRKKIRIEYRLVAYKGAKEMGRSNVLSAEIVNHRYALNTESHKFEGRGQVISPLSHSLFLTAGEIIKPHIGLTDEEIKKCSISVDLISSSSELYKVDLYTAADGSTEVFAEIIEDTGFLEDGDYTGVIDTPGKYIYSEDKIRCAYAVKAVDARPVCLKQPKEHELLHDWHVDIQFAHSSVVAGFRGVKKKFVYDIPEYDTQIFGDSLKPFKDIVNERLSYVNEHLLKTKFKNIYVRPDNIRVYKKNMIGAFIDLEIEEVSTQDGYIFIKETLSSNDEVYCDYTYREDHYTYRGFFKHNDFIKLDTNANVYHKYVNEKVDMTNLTRTSDLLNKYIYFFMKPSAIITDFTNDGQGTIESKTCEKTLTNPVDKFPPTIKVSDGGYTGEIGKNGPSVKVPGRIENQYELFTKELTGNSSYVFPATVDINENGYVGSIPKYGDKILTGGEYSDDRYEKLTAFLTGDVDAIFPSTTSTSDSFGNSHTIPKTGEKYLVGGTPSQEVSEEFEREMTGRHGATFPDTISIDEMGYKGKIPKVGSPIFIGGEEPTVSEMYLETYRDSTDINSFPDTVVAENNVGDRIVCYKVGEPTAHESNESSELVKERRVYQKESDVPDFITITHKGQQVTLPKTSSFKKQIGTENVFVDVGEPEWIRSHTYAFEVLGLHNGNRTESIPSCCLPQNSNFMMMLHNYHSFHRDNPSLPLPNYVHDNDDTTHLNQISAFIRSDFVVKNINGKDYAFVSDDALQVELIRDGVMVPLDHSLSGEWYHRWRYGYGNDNPNLEDVKIVECKNGTSGRGMALSIQPANWLCQHRKEQTVPVYEYIAIYSKEITTGITTWRQEYRGTYTATTQDTRMYKQLYAGVLSKVKPDTREYRQDYAGEVLAKPAADTRRYKQLYKGGLSKEVEIQPYYKQNYRGVIHKETLGSGILGPQATEIIFVIDKNEKLKDYEDNIIGNLKRMYNSLKATKVPNIKMGLVIYGDGSVSKKSFAGSEYTGDINKVIDLFVSEIKTPTTESNTMEASIYAANNYTFATDNRAIIPITVNEPNDINRLYDAINLFKTKKIKGFLVTDTKDEGVRSLQLISMETGGAVGDIKASWSIHIVTAMGKAYLFGTVKVVNRETIYHKIEDEEPDENEDLLIGAIFVRPNATFNSTKIVDARSYGGGVITEMKDNVRRELEPESDWYLDIGYWDGEMMQSNAVVIVRLDRNILEVNGGSFTTDQVESAVNKWIGTGIAFIIEYVEVETPVIEVLPV